MNFRSPSSDESRGYALRARHPSCSETTLQRKEDEPGKRGLRSNGRTIPFGGWGFQWQFLGYRPSDVQLVSKRLWWALGCFLPSCGFTGSDALRRSKYTGRHPTQVREGGLERNECGGSTLTPPPPSPSVSASPLGLSFFWCVFASRLLTDASPRYSDVLQEAHFPRNRTGRRGVPTESVLFSSVVSPFSLLLIGDVVMGAGLRMPVFSAVDRPGA